MVNATHSEPGRLEKANSTTDSHAPAKPAEAHSTLFPQTPLNLFLISLFILPCVLWAVLGLSVQSSPLLLPSSFNEHQHSIPLTSRDCTHPPFDNCSFYTNCLESRYHCGPSGYPLGYGQHFCQSFSDKRSKLSEEGQKWMLNTMHCLQVALVSDATGAGSTTCSALKRKAMGTHAACYVGNGVCELPSADWLAVVEIVQLGTLFQSWDAFKASLQAGLGCLRVRGRLW